MLRFTRATMLLAGVLPNPNCGAVGMPKYPGERARERGGRAEAFCDTWIKEREREREREAAG